ncbi:10809_t:CDS:2, partial [Racocetra persica]
TKKEEEVEKILIEKILREAEEEEIKIEKKSAIRLLIGFAFAVKHYLREEEGNKCHDVRPFISDIQSKLPGFKDLKEQDGDEKDEAQDNNNRGCWPLSLFSSKKKPHQREEKLEGTRTNHNLPLEISLYIADYITTQARKGRIDVPLSNNLLLCVNSLIECLSSFERILRSPIPLAYSIHLTQTVWVYCVSLPFQLVGVVGWSTIVIVFFATFILLGIERIAAEIENPFGYDPNDLKLGDFCRIIERELKLIISHDPPDVDHWVFSIENIDALQRKDSYIDALLADKKNVKLENEKAVDSFFTNSKKENDIAIEVDKEVSR